MTRFTSEQRLAQIIAVGRSTPEDSDLRLLVSALDTAREEMDALRKQVANLAAALWKCELERDDLVDELRVQYETNEVDQ